MKSRNEHRLQALISTDKFDVFTTARLIENYFSVYSLSVVENKWKIAEVDVMRCGVSADSFERLLYIMMGWKKYCIDVHSFCSPLRRSMIACCFASTATRDGHPTQCVQQSDLTGVKADHELYLQHPSYVGHIINVLRKIAELYAGHIERSSYFPSRVTKSDHHRLRLQRHDPSRSIKRWMFALKSMN